MHLELGWMTKANVAPAPGLLNSTPMPSRVQTPNSSLMRTWRRTSMQSSRFYVCCVQGRLCCPTPRWNCNEAGCFLSRSKCQNSERRRVRADNSMKMSPFAQKKMMREVTTSPFFSCLPDAFFLRRYKRLCRKRGGGTGVKEGGF